jgi:hypothetical protein
MPHPDDRRKLLVDITPDAHAILDELLPAFHARERDVVSSALSIREQRELLRLIAKVQHAARQAESTPVPPAAVRHRDRQPAATRSSRTETESTDAL